MKKALTDAQVDAASTAALSQDAENSRRGFYRKLRTTIAASDVIVQVLHLIN